MAALLTQSRITGSVGRGGINQKADVMVVQELVNRKLPPPLLPVKVDGVCGIMTIRAIEEIQRRDLKMNPPDGKVDANGATFRFLSGSGVLPQKSTAAPRFPADVIAAAQASQKNWKIPAAVTLAQWALESGWGKSMPVGSNNPFGIKAAAGQPSVEASTGEVDAGKKITIVAKFRKFGSLTEAFDEHGKLLATASPYAHARALLPDANAFADALTGVYATDPTYGTLLKSIMKSNSLYQYD